MREKSIFSPPSHDERPEMAPSRTKVCFWPRDARTARHVSRGRGPGPQALRSRPRPVRPDRRAPRPRCGRHHSSGLRYRPSWPAAPARPLLPPSRPAPTFLSQPSSTHTRTHIVVAFAREHAPRESRGRRLQHARRRVSRVPNCLVAPHFFPRTRLHPHLPFSPHKQPCATDSARPRPKTVRGTRSTPSPLPSI